MKKLSCEIPDLLICTTQRIGIENRLEQELKLRIRIGIINIQTMTNPSHERRKNCYKGGFKKLKVAGARGRHILLHARQTRSPQSQFNKVKFRHRYYTASSSFISVIKLLNNIYNFSPLVAAHGVGGGG